MSVANHRLKFRPVRGGILILHAVTNEAGTLGMVLTADGTDRWLLTCHHVAARPGGTLVPTDALVQPDAVGGAIATVAGARVDPTLDCAALRLAVPASTEILGIGQPNAVKAPVVGMRVTKSGWKTGVTEAVITRVTESDVVIEKLAGFPDNYLVATGGDSGSVWLEAASLAPVAMHKRESVVGPHSTIATSLPALLALLQLRQV